MSLKTNIKPCTDINQLAVHAQVFAWHGLVVQPNGARQGVEVWQAIKNSNLDAELTEQGRQGRTCGAHAADEESTWVATAIFNCAA